MTAPQDTIDNRAVALAWLWSGTPSSVTDDPVDLETLDQWRQGSLGAERSAQIKRQLADDPRLMQMLEDLVAADELMEQWTAEDARLASSAGLWSQLRQIARDLLSSLREPSWAGGVVVAAAATVFVAILLTVARGPSLDAKLDGLYASLEMSGGEGMLPWGPRIALRGSPRVPIGPGPATPEEMARQAFQVGVIDGIEALRDRYPGLDFSAAEHLPRNLPACVGGDEGCQRQAELARTTGRWALVAHLQCRDAEASEPLGALTLLPALQTAWAEFSADDPLASAVQALSVDEAGCPAIREFLRSWGR